MLLLILFAAAQTATLSANNYAVDEPMPPRPAVLAWADEFNGKHLDASKWSFDTSRNKQGWYNGELQYYAADRPRNLRLRRRAADHRGAQGPASDPRIGRLGRAAI